MTGGRKCFGWRWGRCGKEMGEEMIPDLGDRNLELAFALWS